MSTKDQWSLVAGYLHDELDSSQLRAL